MFTFLYCYVRIDQIMIAWIMPFILANHDSYCSQYSEEWPFPILAPSTDHYAISTRWGNDEVGSGRFWGGSPRGEIRRQIFVSTAGGYRRFCGCASCIVSLSHHAVSPLTELKYRGHSSVLVHFRLPFIRRKHHLRLLFSLLHFAIVAFPFCSLLSHQEVQEKVALFLVSCLGSDIGCYVVSSLLPSWFAEFSFLVAEIDFMYARKGILNKGGIFFFNHFPKWAIFNSSVLSISK